SPRAARALPSFPTRRSSDLDLRALVMRRLDPGADGSDRRLIKTGAPGARERLAADFEQDAFILHSHKFKHHLSILAVSRTVQARSEEHTSELQSRFDLVCRL